VDQTQFDTLTRSLTRIPYRLIHSLVGSERPIVPD